uniref:GRAM domain-containing protein n=2 Tax=Panagrolaimus sp. JU765 TaxID=591449 RepID=A0AC34RIG2_9BILA
MAAKRIFQKNSKDPTRTGTESNMLLEKDKPSYSPLFSKSDLPVLSEEASFLDIQLINMLKQNYDINASVSEKKVGKTDDFSHPGSSTLMKNVKNHCQNFYTNVIDAMSDANENDEKRSLVDNQKLSAYALKRDIKRCLTETQPYLEMLYGLEDLVTWRNPLSSLAMFFVYFYSVYRGWIICLFLFTILLQLTFNYVAEHKQINIGLSFLPRKDVGFKKFDLSGAQLVFDVAKRVQILLTFVADLLEKIKALFTWKKPEVTMKFFGLVGFFFVLSVTTSTSTFLIVIGTLCGGKAFITTFLYHRFPRLRRLLDVALYFYDRLPTSRPTSESPNTSPSAAKRSLGSCENAKSDFKTKHDILVKSNSSFGLNSTTSEMRRRSIAVIPLQSNTDLLMKPGTPACNPEFFDEIGGNETDDVSTSDGDANDDMFIITRSCFLIDKEKPFPRGMSSGTIVLNEKMIGFRYQKVRDGCRDLLQIPFYEILSVKKIRTMRTFSLMPGSHKCLELQLANKKKPIQFLGIPKRDEFYELLIETARIAGVELALDNDEF